MVFLVTTIDPLTVKREFILVEVKGLILVVMFMKKKITGVKL